MDGSGTTKSPVTTLPSTVAMAAPVGILASTSFVNGTASTSPTPAWKVSLIGKRKLSSILPG
eukprot:304984-Heterocapsa_arctica.AAC.1